ncbi:hypothetical protein RB195_003940 [Necator americanus]
MVLIQVELTNTVQVHDLLSFLLARSYNNFRVSEDNFFAPVATSTSSSFPPPLPNPLTCPPPISQVSLATPRSENDSFPPSLTFERKAPATYNPITSTPRHLEQKPASHQRSLMLATSSRNTSLMSTSTSTDLMADDDTDENDLSIDNPSELHDSVTTERDDEASCLMVKTASEESSIDLQQLRKEITRMRRGNLLGGKIECAVCDEKHGIKCKAEALVKHINRMHAKIHMYRCGRCNFSAPERSSVMTHARKHKVIVDGVFDRPEELLLIDIPLSASDIWTLKELMEVCFGIRWKC